MARKKISVSPEISICNKGNSALNLPISCGREGYAIQIGGGSQIAQKGDMKICSPLSALPAVPERSLSEPLEEGLKGRQVV